MPSQIDGAHHQRAKPRYKLFAPTEMTVSGKTRRAHILNISEGGALLHANETPRAHEYVYVVCGEQSRGARVAWVRGTRFGVAFTTALAPVQLDKVVQGGHRQFAPAR